MRMIRTAISPRFATSSLLKSRSLGGSEVGKVEKRAEDDGAIDEKAAARGGKKPLHAVPRKVSGAPSW